MLKTTKFNQNVMSNYFPPNSRAKTGYRFTNDNIKIEHKLGEFRPVMKVMEPIDGEIPDDSSIWLFTANKTVPMPMLVVVHDKIVYRIDTQIELIQLMIDRPKIFSTTATMVGDTLTLHIAVADAAFVEPLDTLTGTQREEMMSVLEAVLAKHMLTDICQSRSSGRDCQPAAKNLAAFYEHVKSVRSRTVEKTANIVDDRLPELRQYQQQTVAWMLERERGHDDEIVEMWMKEAFVTVVGDVLINKYTGHFAHAGRIAAQCSAYIKGGVLAEEMGLGKTVETLAVCLLHPRPHSDTSASPRKKQMKKEKIEPKIPRPTGEDRVFCVCWDKSEDDLVECTVCRRGQHKECVNWSDDFDKDAYKCPPCSLEADKLPVRGTLVIAPASIVKQWSDEVARHVQDDNFSVMIYEGVKQGVKQSRFIQPQELARHDLVVCSYETLRSELDYVNSAQVALRTKNRLRHERKYINPSSPIITLEWWRVCIDEAQLVENASSKAAQMCHQLTAVNRWIVSGTPLTKDIYELPGLLACIGTVSYTEKTHMTKSMIEPYCRGEVQLLARVMAKLMRRTMKSDIKEQLSIPSMSVIVTDVQLSASEKEVMRQMQTRMQGRLPATFNQYVRRVAEGTLGADERLENLDPYIITHVTHMLLQLRKSCVHSSLVQFDQTKKTSQKFLTMAETMSRMVADTRRRCVDAQRAVVMTRNKLAGLAMHGGDRDGARDMYTMTVAKSEELDDRIAIDPLPYLHACHHLLALDHDPARRELLREKIDEKRGTYLADSIASWTEAYAKYARDKFAVDEDGIRSFEEASRLLIEDGGERKVADTVMKAVRRQAPGSTARARGIIKLAEICEYASEYLVTVREANRVCEENIQQLLLHRHDLSNVEHCQNLEIVNDCRVCHLRPNGAALNSCLLCVADRLIVDYRRAIGMHGYPAVTVVVMLKSILQLAKKCARVDAVTKKKMNVLIKQLEVGHFNRVALLQQVRNKMAELVANHDKIVMAIENQVVPQNYGARALQQVLAEQEQVLRARLGRLTYAHHLQRQGNTVAQTEEEAMTYCAICLEDEPLTKRTMVMFPQCGHWICVKCFRQEQHRQEIGKTILCAHCRVPAVIADVVYMCDAGDEVTVKIKGHERLSSKLCAVMKSLMGVLDGKTTDSNVSLEEEPNRVSKVIVFSQWDTVLHNLARVLDMNDIAHSNCVGSKMELAIEQWKKDPDVNVLLLPLHCGARGLNLTEGEHVFFVEPIMNAAAESQAIARVHRLGQKRHTYVHKFIVENSVESIIHSRGVKNGDVMETPITTAVVKGLPLNLSVHELHTMFTVDY